MFLKPEKWLNIMYTELITVMPISRRSKPGERVQIKGMTGNCVLQFAKRANVE